MPARKYPKRDDLSVADLAYMAGIMDGEGTITVTKLFPKQNRGAGSHKAMITVSNTNLSVLVWIQERFGGAIRLARLHSEKHRQAYRWEAMWAQAAAIIQDILPYLIIKRAHGVLFLEFFKTICPRSRRGRGGGLSEEAKRQRLEIAAEFRVLNNRSVPIASATTH